MEKCQMKLSIPVPDLPEPVVITWPVLEDVQHSESCTPCSSDCSLHGVLDHSKSGTSSQQTSSLLPEASVDVNVRGHHNVNFQSSDMDLTLKSVSAVEHQPSTLQGNLLLPSTPVVGHQPSTLQGNILLPSTSVVGHQPSTLQGNLLLPSTPVVGHQPSTLQGNLMLPSTPDVGHQPSTLQGNLMLPSTPDVGHQPSTLQGNLLLPSTPVVGHQPSTLQGNLMLPSTPDTGNQPSTLQENLLLPPTQSVGYQPSMLQGKLILVSPPSVETEALIQQVNPVFESTQSVGQENLLVESASSVEQELGCPLNTLSPPPEDKTHTVPECVISLLESLVDPKNFSSPPKSPKKQRDIIDVTLCPEKVMKEPKSAYVNNLLEKISTKGTTCVESVPKVAASAACTNNVLDVVPDDPAVPDALSQIAEFESFLRTTNFGSIAKSDIYGKFFSHNPSGHEEDATMIQSTITVNACSNSPVKTDDVNESLFSSNSSVTSKYVHKKTCFERTRSSSSYQESCVDIPTQDKEYNTGSSSFVSASHAEHTNVIVVPDHHITTAPLQEHPEVLQTSCNPKTFVCSVCSKAFSRRMRLISHQSRRGHYSSYKASYHGGTKLTLTLVNKDN